jgi:hypothetical protein
MLTLARSTVTWGQWLTYLDDDRDSQPHIIFNLDDSEADFRSGDFPAGEPVIRRITKHMEGSGTIQQSNGGSSLAASASETTTLTLSNGAAVSSTVPTDERLNW